MTALDYLLVLELLMLVSAFILWLIGEVFARVDAQDELCQVMRAFWSEFGRTRSLRFSTGLFGARSDAVDERAAWFSKRREKRDEPAAATSMPSYAVKLAIKVVPGSSRDEIAGRLGDAIKIKVMAAPEGGQANRAVIDLLAEALDVPAYRIKLVRGHYDSRKLMQISGMSQAQVDEKLANFL